MKKKLHRPKHKPFLMFVLIFATSAIFHVYRIKEGRMWQSFKGALKRNNCNLCNVTGQQHLHVKVKTKLLWLAAQSVKP